MSIDVRAQLEDQDAQKFDQLQAYLKETTSGQKYGKANTVRIAVRLAHEKMEELQQERKETVKDFKKYERKLERLTDTV